MALTQAGPTLWGMQLYAITDRTLLPGTEQQQRDGIVELARKWTRAGVDYIQIREKDLDERELLELAEQVMKAVREESARTRVLLNGRAQIALNSGADGFHLVGDAPEGAAQQGRNLFVRAGREVVVSYACHSRENVLKAKAESQRDVHATAANTLILYAPVFEKATPNERLPGRGLEALKDAVEAAKPIPVFALGGVTRQNAASCIWAGARGVAGIRLFLENGWQQLKMNQD